MIRVNVSVTNISAERFWDIQKPVPPIQISTNLNLVDVEKKSDEMLEVPFMLTVSYSPSIAQINLRGRAYVAGDKAELDKVFADYKAKKPPPPAIVQSISNVAFVESVIVSRSLSIPPPIPLPQIPPAQQPSEKKPSGLDYSA